MTLALALLAIAASPANRFNGSFPRTQPIEDLLGGLLGLTLAFVIVRTVMWARRQFPGVDPFDGASSPPLNLEQMLALKLSQWRSSTLILITVTALAMCVAWFRSLAPLHLTGYGSFADQLAIPLAMSMQSYLFTFVPVLVWHLADLIERPRAKPKFLTVFTSHALLTGVLVTSGSGFVLAATGWFTVQRPCGGPFTLMFQSCSGVVPALSLPTVLLLLVLPLITLVKLAVVLRSILGPRR